MTDGLSSDGVDPVDRTGEPRLGAADAPAQAAAAREGRLAEALDQARNRLVITGVVLALAFGAVSAKLVQATLLRDAPENRNATITVPNPSPSQVSRADIFDRHGTLLATSLATASLYADPKLVLDPKDAATKLVKALPDLDYEEVHDKLASDKRFVWIKRSLTPRQHYAVHVLGLPGLFFQREDRRFYPAGSLTSHVVGFTGVDNSGLAGLEQSFDRRLRTDPTPIQTSLDVRLQHLVRIQLQQQIDEFKAIGGGGIVYDINTGEILAMVSLPDFDPQNPTGLDKDTLFNRNTLGVYEMGSTFKIFNSAMAFESGKIRMTDSFDASHSIHVGRFTITDYHNEGRWLTVPEIFMYSSNIGSVRMALQVGIASQRAFMQKMGFMRPVPIEIPEVGWPLVPNPWREINTMTISFGHGMSVSPMHVIAAAAATINGGIMYKPTLLKLPPGATPSGERVVSPQTSEEMRRLFRLVVTNGTAKFANAPGYVVGGKTGTADKQRGRHYAKNANLTSFVGAFPMNAPRYIVFAMIDEPKPSANSYGFATAGWVAAPVVGRLIKLIGPLLGVEPVDENRPEIHQALDIDKLSKGATVAALRPDAHE